MARNCRSWLRGAAQHRRPHEGAHHRDRSRLLQLSRDRTDAHLARPPRVETPRVTWGIFAEGAFAKDKLDPEYVREEEARVTRGYRRLRELAALDLPISEYPLPEVLSRRQAQSHRAGT